MPGARPASMSGWRGEGLDERGLAALRRLRAVEDDKPRLTLSEFKTLVREQYFMLLIDQAETLAAMPRLLPPDAGDPTQERFIVLCHVLNAASASVTGEAARPPEADGPAVRCRGRSKYRARASKVDRKARACMSDELVEIRSPDHGAKQVAAVRGAVVHPCDETSLRGVVRSRGERSAHSCSRRARPTDRDHRTRA